MPTQSVKQGMITEREAFYRDRMGWLITLIVCLGVALVGLILLLLILRTGSAPQPRFFKATPNLQLIETVPLHEPGIPDGVLLNWVVESMVIGHSFNFKNYQRVMDAMQEYFLEEGYTFYTKALQNTQVINQVVDSKWVIVTTPLSAPTITKKGKLEDRYLWKVRLPIQLNFRGVGVNTQERKVITLLITRVPTTVSPYGIAIMRYFLEEERSQI